MTNLTPFTTRPERAAERGSMTAAVLPVNAIVPTLSLSRT
jgi:hypothetical protein